MDDQIEMTVTINSDSFPLLFKHLIEVKAGRRRAGAIKRLAENFLLLSQRELVRSDQRIQPSAETSTTTKAIQLGPLEGTEHLSIDCQAVRSSLSQFGFG